MSWTCSPASAIALRLASAARVNVVTPDLRENAVQPIPAIAVLSLIVCSGIVASTLCFVTPSHLFKIMSSIHEKPAFIRFSVGKNLFQQLRVFVEVFGPGRVDRHNLRSSHFYALILRQVGPRDQSSGVLIQLLSFFRQQKVNEQSGRGGVRRLRDKTNSDHEPRQRSWRNPIDRCAFLL